METMAKIKLPFHRQVLEQLANWSGAFPRTYALAAKLLPFRWSLIGCHMTPNPFWKRTHTQTGRAGNIPERLNFFTVISSRFLILIILRILPQRTSYFDKSGDLFRFL